MQNLVSGVSFVIWRVILNEIVQNFWMLWVTDIKQLRHEKLLLGVKASKTRLMSEAEARRQEKPQELAMKKVQAVLEETSEPEPGTAANESKIEYKAASRDALNRVQQEMATREIEQKSEARTQKRENPRAAQLL